MRGRTKFGSDRYKGMLDGRPTPYQAESKAVGRFAQHGEEEHRGHRCKVCAGQSKKALKTRDRMDGTDEIIQWNEDCDRIRNEVDQRLLTHIRDHHPPNCGLGCTDLPHFPERPDIPYERRHNA